MSWIDFSDLATDHFNMAADVAARFFELVPGAVAFGVPAAPTWLELTFLEYAFVPRAPKNFYAQLPANKRERDFCLVWLPPSAADRLTTVKLAGNKNAGRIYDTQRAKWYAVSKEWDYLRQGSLNGVIGELIDKPVPGNLPVL